MQNPDQLTGLNENPTVRKALTSVQAVRRMQRSRQWQDGVLCVAHSDHRKQEPARARAQQSVKGQAGQQEIELQALEWPQ